MWCMQRTNIYLEDRQTAALDRLAGEEGISRAELIRRMLDRALRGPEDLTADLARMDFAFGGSVEIDVTSRARDAREQRLDALMDATE
jgi:hypothetical protein